MQINNLVKTYKIKKNTVEALKGVSFDLPDSGMVFILGKSGCGKTTLLNCLSGLDSFDSGEIIFKGQNLKELSHAELDDYRNTYCGFVFQEYNLLPELNVKDNLALALQLKGEKEVESKVSEALKKVELEGYELRKVNELSGGQKQRVAIARCIIKEPQIIFADEPSGALDSKTGEIVFSLLKELSKEKLVIVVSHNKDYAKRYGDRIIELSDGKIINDTVENYINKNPNVTYKTDSSKMPIKAALKIGCANYKYHPIRFAVTIFLAVFSFTFFGLSISYGLMDKVNPFVNAVYKNNLEYVTLKHYSAEFLDEEYLITFEDVIEGFWHWENIPIFSWKLNERHEEKVPFNKENIDELQAHYSEQLELVVNDEVFLNINSIRKRTDFSEQNEQELNIWTNRVFYGAMTLHEEVIEKFDFELIGKLPQNKNEVVVSESYYNYLMMYGLYGEDGKEYEFTSPQDLVEKKIVLDDMLITGVLLTGCDLACKDNHEYDHITSGGNSSTGIYWQLDNEYLYHCKMFVTEDYIFDYIKNYYEMSGEDNYNIFFVLCPVGKNKKQFKNFTEYLIDNNKLYQDRGGEYFDFSSWRRSNGESVSCDFIDYREIAIANSKDFSVLSLYIGIIFFIFTVVFLLNFITSSIQGQMKQIGIVSALGADFKKLFLVYLLSSLILCGAVYLLTLLSTGIFIACINGTEFFGIWNLYNEINYTFNILSLNIWVILILFVLSVFTALLGALISMRKLRKLTPADIIRKGQIK